MKTIELTQGYTTQVNREMEKETQVIIDRHIQ